MFLRRNVFALKKRRDSTGMIMIKRRSHNAWKAPRIDPLFNIGDLPVRAFLREFLSVAIVLSPLQERLYVGTRARGNQLIHRTVIREHPPLHPHPLVLILLVYSSSSSSSSALSSATIHVHLVGVWYILSVSLARTRATKILVEIESREAEPSRAEPRVDPLAFICA